MCRVKVRDLMYLPRIRWMAAESDQGQFRHPEKGMVVTVPGRHGKDVPLGSLRAILRSAGLEEKKEG